MEIVALHDQKMPPERPVLAGNSGVTLIGGGALQADDLDAARALAPTVVAVDGGADAALSAGVIPAAVIGDMDSISDAARARMPHTAVHHIAEQDSTDFDKALRHLDVPLVVAVGFTGARLDHELAVFHSLVRQANRCCIVLGERDIVFHAPPRLELSLQAGSRVSLFPMAEVNGRSTGLRWPIDGLVLHPARRIGTSNAATGGTVSIETDTPGLLVILPREDLATAAGALTLIGDKLWIV